MLQVYSDRIRDILLGYRDRIRDILQGYSDRIREVLQGYRDWIETCYKDEVIGSELCCKYTWI